MHVFVVGATGVLGRALLPLLAAQGHTVRAMVRSPTGSALPAPAGVELVVGDLLTAEIPDRLPGLLSGCDVVVHAATAVPRDAGAPGAWETNTRLRTEGTRRLLAGALMSGVRGYIQQSIVMAYPDGGDRWLDESTAIDTTPRRAAVCAPVAEMEGLVRGVTGLRWCILRGGYFLGPGTFQAAQVEQLRGGRTIVAGNGSAFFSPVHVADMAAAVVAAVERLPDGATLNVVAEPLRWGLYLDSLARLVGVAPPPRDPARLEPPSHRCTNDAARSVLGWSPRRSIWPAGQGRPSDRPAE